LRECNQFYVSSGVCGNWRAPLSEPSVLLLDEPTDTPALEPSLRMALLTSAVDSTAPHEGSDRARSATLS
jgi:hypothetical protein